MKGQLSASATGRHGGQATFLDRGTLLFMETLQTVHEINDLGRLGLAGSVIVFGRADNQLDHIREATTATTALAHGMIDLGGNDQLPTIFIKQLSDD